MQTRQKFKEAYEAEFDATIERAEKQIILARHGRRLLKLLDDTPVVPGDVRTAYNGGAQARQILNDAEDDLREWRPELPEDDDAAMVQANTRAAAMMSGGLGSGSHARENRGLDTEADGAEAGEGKKAAGPGGETG